MTGLRERQRVLARTTIAEAAADLVTERHQLDFSMQEVAERAGVSLRTVYNHFETREDLLDELGRDFGRRMSEAGGPDAGDVETLDDLLSALAVNFRLMSEMGGISEAFAQMPLADIGRDAVRSERTEVLVSLMAGSIADTVDAQVPDAQARNIALLLRHLFSHRSWFWLTREYGIANADLAPLITWVITTLVDAAKRGDLPGTEQT